MTISFGALLFYMCALFVLFIVPGPVWIAILARTMVGGIPAALPIALGVAVGDVIWSLGAIIGISALVMAYENFIFWLHYGAALILITMGVGVIKYAHTTFSENSHINAPGAFSGFLAGLVVVLTNPKACIFYLALLPGFFHITNLSIVDIILIAVASFFVPLMGNVMLMSCVGFVRQFLIKPRGVFWVSISSGLSLIAIGVAIAISNI